MHKVYMSELILIEVEVKNKLNKEIKEGKISFKEVLNNILKEYFEIKELLEKCASSEEVRERVKM